VRREEYCGLIELTLLGTRRAVARMAYFDVGIQSFLEGLELLIVPIVINSL
jgi:hypothetical protein